MNSETIINEFNNMFPDARCELNYNKDYELLLSVMLSAQTTDKGVNIATKDLYEKYNTLDKLNKLSVSDIEKYIKRIGFYKVKSRNFKTIVEKLLDIGYVPNDRKFLESLPGVGRKTTSVVLGQLYNEPNFAVDTHVNRVSKRLGISKEKDDILKTEEKLKKYFKKEDWNRVNSQMVLFGRYHCTSKNPKCNECNLKQICKKSQLS